MNLSQALSHYHTTTRLRDDLRERLRAAETEREEAVEVLVREAEKVESQFGVLKEIAREMEEEL